jgi:hypothetical protein
MIDSTVFLTGDFDFGKSRPYKLRPCQTLSFQYKCRRTNFLRAIVGARIAQLSTGYIAQLSTGYIARL